MPKKKYHLSNWKEYNRKLEERGSIEIWFDEGVIGKWKELPKKKGKKAGRPKEYGDAAIKCALVFKYVHRLAFRQMQRFVSDLVKALNLEVKVPDYSTVCNMMRNNRNERFLGKSLIEYRQIVTVLETDAFFVPREKVLIKDLSQE